MNSKSGELFIVDNEDESWKALKYLEDWTEIAKQFDIASGYFEIGALLALDGKWQKLDHIRILMGDEMTSRTRAALLEGLKQKVKAALDQSLEQAKEERDFLQGVPAILDAIRSGKIECKIYAKRKFHAKAYITHGKLEVVGSAALVGSSNFTLPGLTQNIELNVQLRSPGDVEQLQKWFERHWDEGEDVKDEIIQIIERHTAAYTPFQVYVKGLQEIFRDKEMDVDNWDRLESRVYRRLDQYQREAYHALMKISRKHLGALLCDGVGLGKTFVGLMLIERMIHERKRVLLLVPRSGRKPVWERNLKKHLPHLFRGFSNLKIFNHTDLMRKANEVVDFPAELEEMLQQADVVVIDEAHHFRNRGLANEEDGSIRSRYWKLHRLCQGKQVILLTATPVNNSLTDFQHLIELFCPRQDFFAGSLGIHNIPAHFQVLEKQLASIVRGEALGELFASDPQAQHVLFDDKLFKELVVQRSRAYVRESQIKHGGGDVLFPTKLDPEVVQYSVKKTYGHLLGVIEKAFAKDKPLFALALYYPLAYWKGDPTQLASFDVNRQKQVVRLIRLLFLKRFESSIVAFESSCQTLLLKLMAFLDKNIDPASAAERKRFEKWKAMHGEILATVETRRQHILEDEDAEENDLEDLYADEFEVLSREDFKVDEIMDETYSDMDQVLQFLQELHNIHPDQDNKLQSLIKKLKSDKVLKNHKVLIFSEFMSTARYLRRELKKAGIQKVDEIDSASDRERTDVIQQFAPYYNESSSALLKEEGREEIRVLISTDVLSEGLNLQDATRIINYDIHWNPVRVMQRIGRVDRRMDPAIEARILADHPEQKTLRGQVQCLNFIPPDELDELLGLYRRVTHKTLRISKVLGIEGKKFLHPQDDFDAIKEFNHAYEGEASPIEKLHLEYQQLTRDEPTLEDFLNTLPLRVFSGREKIKGARALFLCYRLPAEDKTVPPEQAWEGSAFRTRWLLADLEGGNILEEPAQIADFIRSKPDTPRHTEIDPTALRELRLRVEKHLKNTYLKQVQAPVGVKPTLMCWMELN
jgi:superfamily II DNA or RNA helicase